MLYSQFKAYFDDKKFNNDPLFCRIVYRPISLYLGWILHGLRFSANSVTILSILLTILGCSLFSIGNLFFAKVASILMLCIGLTDCVDGNIARASNKLSIQGEWLDAVSGYLVYGFLPLSIGIFLESNSLSISNNLNWIVIGGLVSILNLITRVIYQKFTNLMLNSSSFQKDINIKSSFSIGNEIGLVGFMMPFLVLATFFDFLNIYLLTYLSIYIISFLYVFFKTITKGSYIQ